MQLQDKQVIDTPEVSGEQMNHNIKAQGRAQWIKSLLCV